MTYKLLMAVNLLLSICLVVIAVFNGIVDGRLFHGFSIVFGWFSGAYSIHKYMVNNGN